MLRIEATFSAEAKTRCASDRCATERPSRSADPVGEPRPEYLACPKAGMQKTTIVKNIFIAVCSTRDRFLALQPLRSSAQYTGRHNPLRRAPEVTPGFAIMFVCSNPAVFAPGFIERELCRRM
jgi:hypothetical protein